MQIRLFIAVLIGLYKLPSCNEMKDELQKELSQYALSGDEIKHYLRFWERQWPYYEECAMLSKTEFLPDHIYAIYNITTERLLLSLTDFKNYRYSVSDSGEVIETLELNGEILNTKFELWKLRIKAAFNTLFFAFPQVMKLLIHVLYHKLNALFIRQ